MDIQVLNRLNELWQPIYPFLAEWISRWCPRHTGRILELGPFSGGISTSLINQFPSIEAVCLVQRESWLDTVRSSFHSDIAYTLGNPASLPFGPSFELIISRGAFFFLTPGMISATYKALCGRGCALLGGGYGPLTPPAAIEPIALESKELNYRLGKRLVSREELHQMVFDIGLDSCATIIEEGGLWLLIRNDETESLQQTGDIK
jgi:hypothetical protein